jgi:hypothetical protein
VVVVAGCVVANAVVVVAGCVVPHVVAVVVVSHIVRVLIVAGCIVAYEVVAIGIHRNKQIFDHNTKMRLNM